MYQWLKKQTHYLKISSKTEAFSFDADFGILIFVENFYLNVSNRGVI
jgi:hypothetical protein